MVPMSLVQPLTFTGLGLVVVAVLQARTRFFGDRRRGRLFYWACGLTGATVFTVANHVSTPRTLVMATIWVGLLAVLAFSATPYLKIGGRIYAAREEDREPDPPVG